MFNLKLKHVLQIPLIICLYLSKIFKKNDIENIKIILYLKKIIKK